MLKIVYPQSGFKMKEEGGKEQIFDEVRKQWVRLNPEEWVRQNWIQYLIQTMQYPLKWISVEKEIELNGLKKRYDIVVYRESKPWMIIECKETEVKLSSSALEQVLRYNMALPVEYLIITNGYYNYGWKNASGVAMEIGELPKY
jgi:hypothetical protein